MSVVCSCIRLSAGLLHDTKLSVALWAVVEASTALCVASAPALRPLIFRTSYFSRETSATGPTRTARHGPGGHKSRTNRTATNISETRIGYSFEFPDAVQVTKVVQVTTTQVPPSTGSSGATFYEPSKHKHKPAIPSIDPRTLGYQAEVVGGEDEIGTEVDFKLRDRDIV